ncbi:rhamnogalacturonan acetylesterase [Actinoplanes sp. LDG1-06]|uniref:Rhamnogalacturonan acetylesterase n=1 Tax=Paractinoplanes ovalisporus TaxID=2810368 RepID=A0ABS2ALL8_9ACTN|nr:rhamnogalacturonan acetylesterase [Actinoplanes ovalisporus]MBM2620743.1 rhamnogalacturonan acetylesterase [Actinoplanes ovalisporus]
MVLDRRTLLRAALGGAVVSAYGTEPALAGGRGNRRTVFVAGDSTAATYATADVPRAGWGQALPVFLRPDIAVENAALSGASSKSFADLGRLDLILAAIRPGDVLLISFGHNDEKAEDPARYTEPWTTFQDYLRLYLDGARARRARPILVTPVERRRFRTDGTPYLSHGEYPDSMRALAEATRTPLIDLTARSFALWSELGPEPTKDYFLWLDPGEMPNYPDGVADNTHFQAHGAIEVARLVAAAGAGIPGRDRRALHDPSIPDDVLAWPPTRPAES